MFWPEHRIAVARTGRGANVHIHLFGFCENAGIDHLRRNHFVRHAEKMHVGICTQRLHGIRLEKIGNGALGAAGDFLDHPAAWRDFIAFVNLFGDVHGDNAAFRPCGAQHLSRGLGIEKNVEGVGEPRGSRFP